MWEPFWMTYPFWRKRSTIDRRPIFADGQFQWSDVLISSSAS